MLKLAWLNSGWGMNKQLPQETAFFALNRIENYHWLTIFYFAVWSGIILFYFKRIPQAGVFLILHVTGMMVSFFLSGIQPSFRIVRILRDWYPAFLLPLFFTALHYLIPAIHPAHIDFELIQIDRMITGNDPTVWVDRFYHPMLTEIFQFSYSTFYILPLFVLLPLYKSGQKSEFRHDAFIVLIAFYFSYVCYLIFPALGPRFFLAHLHTTPLDGYKVFHFFNATLNGLENIQWDAFPSAHVAITLLVAYFAFLHFKRIFYFLSPIILSLVLSTIYLRYHYLIDVLAGFVIVAVLIFIEKLLRRKTILKKGSSEISLMIPVVEK